MNDKIREALAGLLAIVDDSQGVAGYHLSGNIAEWGEFAEVEAARAALTLQVTRGQGLDDFELEDMARSALEEGFSFGVNLDVFMRFARRIESAVVSQQPAPAVPDGYVLVTPEQLEKHTTTAWECPPQSLVVLVSSLKRLHDKNSAAPAPAAQEPMQMHHEPHNRAMWHMNCPGRRFESPMRPLDDQGAWECVVCKQVGYTAPPAAEQPGTIPLSREDAEVIASFFETGGSIRLVDAGHRVAHKLRAMLAKEGV